ncbi:hypothetical protein LINPERPRIM_LOCUS36420 [Linum perenne]
MTKKKKNRSVESAAGIFGCGVGGEEKSDHRDGGGGMMVENGISTVHNRGKLMAAASVQRKEEEAGVTPCTERERGWSLSTDRNRVEVREAAKRAAAAVEMAYGRLSISDFMRG